MSFSCDDLVRCVSEAWKQHQRPLVHNWAQNPFSSHAESIRGWCAAQTQPIDWGDPHGFPVQEAQRKERAQPHPRIAVWQEQGGHRRIMFSASQQHDPQAFAAANVFALANGFFPLP